MLIYITDKQSAQNKGFPGGHMYILLLAVIYLAFISLGLPDSLMSSGWPAMHVSLSVPVSYMGILTMIICAGTIISSLFSERLTVRFGTKGVAAFSIFLVALAMIGFSFSNSFALLIVLSVPYGLGAGAIDASLNDYVARHYSSGKLTWLHCFWGVGSILSPFVMRYSLEHTDWHAGYRIMGILQLIIGLIVVISFPLWKREETVSDKERKVTGILGAVRTKGVPALLIGFFAYCAMEGTLMFWSGTYYYEVKGMSEEAAAGLASLFYIGITAGRLFCGFITDKIGDKRMIIAGTAVLCTGAVLMLLPLHNYLNYAAMIIIGVGCAPIYPCIIHSTTGNFGNEKASAIIGVQMASAYVGATFMPPLFGVIGSSVWFGLLPVYSLVLAGLMITMVMMMFRICTKEKETGTSD